MAFGYSHYIAAQQHKERQMNAQHTPGPWRYVRENGSPTTGQHMIAGAKPGYLAEVRDCGSGDVKANARLIAAAPELLEVAEGILVDDLLPLLPAEYISKVRSAIAAAKGN